MELTVRHRALWFITLILLQRLTQLPQTTHRRTRQRNISLLVALLNATLSINSGLLLFGSHQSHKTHKADSCSVSSFEFMSCNLHTICRRRSPPLGQNLHITANLLLNSLSFMDLSSPTTKPGQEVHFQIVILIDFSEKFNDLTDFLSPLSYVVTDHFKNN